MAPAWEDLQLGSARDVRLRDLAPALQAYIMATLDWAQRDKGRDRLQRLALQFSSSIPGLVRATDALSSDVPTSKDDARSTTWKTFGGREWAIRNLTDQHLANIILMLAIHEARPMQWPALVQEAKARSLQYGLDGGVKRTTLWREEADVRAPDHEAEFEGGRDVVGRDQAETSADGSTSNDSRKHCTHREGV
jgi:hypothetical protein